MLLAVSPVIIIFAVLKATPASVRFDVTVIVRLVMAPLAIKRPVVPIPPK